MTMAASRIGVRAAGDLAFTVAILVIVAASMIATWDWPYAARLMPLAVGVPAALLSLALVVRGIWRLVHGVAPQESDRVMDLRADRDLDNDVFAARAAAMFAWVFGFAVLIWLVGFLSGVPLFVFLYVLLQAREKWWVALFYSAGMFLFMAVVFHYILHVSWMRGQFNGLQRLMLGLLNQLY